MRNHPLIRSLLNLRGNPRACVYTEPLWGIPYNLYMPFVSVFMLALGVTDVQIGLVASLTLLFRTITAGLSGAITDKLGRKMATVIFDTLAWSVPCALWAFSQNVWWFMVAAAFNGFWQITENSWTCLLVEDAEKSQMVNIYSLIHIAGQMAVFFAPIAGLLVKGLTIVPAMRILYGFSCLSMTAKFVLLFFYCDETKAGRVRLQETRGMSLWAILAEYKDLIPRFFRSGNMVLAMTITVLFTITTTIMQNFFGVYATQAMGVADQFLAYFPIIRSAIMLLFLFFIQNRIARFGYKGPMLVGVGMYLLSHTALLLLPAKNLTVLVVYTVLEACAHGLVIPRKDSIAALFIDPKERARMISIMTVVVLGVSIPFGAIAGMLSGVDRRLPFLLDLVLFGVSFVVILTSRSLSRENTGAVAE